MLEKFKARHSDTGIGQIDNEETGKAEITCIGEAISIEGSISGKGNLIVQGNMKGTIDLSGQQFTVGKKGSVEADIKAEKVTISGKMKGNVSARGKVEITKSADFEGEIRAKRISVEDGAYMKAVIELEKEKPAKKSDPKPTLYNKSGASQQDTIKISENK